MPSHEASWTPTTSSVLPSFNTSELQVEEYVIEVIPGLKTNDLGSRGARALANNMSTSRIPIPVRCIVCYSGYFCEVKEKGKGEKEKKK
jgi:hypothetical protein